MTTKRNPLTTTHGKNGVPELQAIAPEDEYLGLDLLTMEQLQKLIARHAAKATWNHLSASGHAGEARTGERAAENMALAEASIELAKADVTVAIIANSLLPTVERAERSRALHRMRQRIDATGVLVEAVRRRLEGAS